MRIVGISWLALEAWKGHARHATIRYVNCQAPLLGGPLTYRSVHYYGTTKVHANSIHITQ
jgi:hypothetical protein